jgi:UDP-GlcNAc:undecaprenyl-phosphate/decaprenyl-phosphate GlcNAc-1-phosphate transferase
MQGVLICMKPFLSDLIMFAAAFIISAALIPLIIRLSQKHRIYDTTGGRKIHSGNIPRLGGLGIFISFLFITVYELYTTRGLSYSRELYLTALVLAFLTGFADDLFRIRARYKLIMQIVISMVAVSSGLVFTTVKIYNFARIDFGNFSYIITIVWIIAFMNAINLIDGMDGLSTGIVLIANIFVFVIATQSGNTLVAALSAVLGGAVLGFYIFNYPPARIFLGDGGAYFIGFVYATLPLMGIKKSAVLTLFLIPMVLMLVPIADVTQVMLHRYKRGHNIFFPDRNHLHHRLMKIGFSTRGILFVMYTYTMVLGLSSILMLNMHPELSLILFGIIVLLLMLSFYLLSSAERVIERMEEKSDNKGKKAQRKRK